MTARTFDDKQAESAEDALTVARETNTRLNRRCQELERKLRIASNAAHHTMDLADRFQREYHHYEKEWWKMRNKYRNIRGSTGVSILLALGLVVDDG